MTHHRRFVLPILAAGIAAVLSACSSGSAPVPLSRTSGTVRSPQSTPSAPQPSPPTSRSSHHAALSAPTTGFTPSLAKAPNDKMPGYNGACQVSQSSSTTRLCTFGDTSNPALTVAVVGDSVANEWLGALVAIGKPRHWKIVTDYHSRCPWSATMTVNTGFTTPYTSCHAWGVAAMHDVLTRIKPDVVVTSDRPVLGTPQHLTPGPASLAQIGAGMATYWRKLLAHHIAVVPIRESPEMGFDVPTCLRYNSVSACTVRAAKAVTKNPPTVVAARAMKGAVHLVDMNAVICPHGTCRPIAGRIVKFRDLHHLTYTYVRSIAWKLKPKLLATGAFTN